MPGRGDDHAETRCCSSWREKRQLTSGVVVPGLGIDWQPQRSAAGADTFSDCATNRPAGTLL